MLPHLRLVDNRCDAQSSWGARCTKRWTTTRAMTRGHIHVCGRHAKTKRLKAHASRRQVPRTGCSICEAAVAA